MSNLNGKIAVVTGGNSGIGYASAKEMKEKGANVIITGRSEERVNKAATELGCKGIVADVSDLKQIDNLVAQVKDEFEKVDILFVNAGVFKPIPIGQASEEDFDYHININFKGAVFTIEKFLHILNEGASIINLSSINSYIGIGMSNTGVYAASKAALNAYARVAATELAPRKIRVNTINPGPVVTPIYGKSGIPEEQLKDFSAVMQDRVPLKRFAEATEIAKLVAFLASDDSSFITGSEYNIDGGVGINPIVG